MYKGDNMKFILEIDLDSDKMQSRWDIAAVLRTTALQLKQITIGKTVSGDYSPIREGEYNLVRDLNGNIVGKWEVTVTPEAVDDTNASITDLRKRYEALRLLNPDPANPHSSASHEERQAWKRLEEAIADSTKGTAFNLSGF